jgi:3-oxoacyl-[acyl-carrier protein] reductase
MAPEQPVHADIFAAFNLAGRVAVVTGAASGIGAQAAITFAQAGADVVCVDLDINGMEATASRVRELGRAATIVATDVSNKGAVDTLAEQTLAKHRRIDVWANVAGVLRRALITETTEADFDALIAVNLKGVFWGSAAAARVMSRAGHGSIINVASGAGDIASPNVGAYAATKAGVMMITRTLAMEVGARGVRVNAVAPGFIETPMVSGPWTKSNGAVDDDLRKSMLKGRADQSPLGLTGEPSDIAWAMLYLAVDASRFVTGQIMRPNGGVVMP